MYIRNILSKDIENIMDAEKATLYLTSFILVFAIATELHKLI